MRLEELRERATPPRRELEDLYAEEADEAAAEAAEDDAEAEADDLWEALLLLQAAREALRGISLLDGHIDFLSKPAATDLESLVVKIDDLISQYDLEEDESGMFESITGSGQYR